MILYNDELYFTMPLGMLVILAFALNSRSRLSSYQIWMILELIHDRVLDLIIDGFDAMMDSMIPFITKTYEHRSIVFEVAQQI